MRLTSIASLVSRVRGAKLAASGAFLGAVTLLAALPRPLSAAYPPSAEGGSIAAATDHSEATRAALDIMGAGGNAVDGAIAAALALGVVNPSSSGIGGGGFALVFTAKDKKVTVLDFRETAPKTYGPDVLWPPLKPGEEKPKSRWEWRGPKGGVVGVPGEPAGLEELSRRFAKKSLAEDAARAVSLAQHGFAAGKHLVDMSALMKDRLEKIPALGGTFLPGGHPVVLGSRVTRPELAATLLRYGAQGKRSFYEGDTAKTVSYTHLTLPTKA